MPRSANAARAAIEPPSGSAPAAPGCPLQRGAAICSAGVVGSNAGRLAGAVHVDLDVAAGCAASRSRRSSVAATSAGAGPGRAASTAWRSPWPAMIVRTCTASPPAMPLTSSDGVGPVALVEVGDAPGRLGRAGRRPARSRRPLGSVAHARARPAIGASMPSRSSSRSRPSGPGRTAASIACSTCAAFERGAAVDAGVQVARAVRTSAPICTMPRAPSVSAGRALVDQAAVEDDRRSRRRARPGRASAARGRRRSPPRPPERRARGPAARRRGRARRRRAAAAGSCPCRRDAPRA